MHVEILGTAAGGAFPQWNCACRNCSRLRSGTFSGRARTQLQVAISSDRVSWCLLNASPDLRVQIESNSFLHPRAENRDSPISSVVLTSADLDQCLGLLLLRELQPIELFVAASIRRILREDNSMFSMLQRKEDQAHWHDITPGIAFKLFPEVSGQSQIECLPLTVGMRYPSYVTAERAAQLERGEAVLGLILHAKSGKRLGYFPAVGQINAAVLDHFDSLDVLLFDGTFWTDDELIKIQNGGQTAFQMGHIPVSSAMGSLELLSELRCPRKIFVHINNTNPMLDVTGPEYREVRESGWEIAEDGCHLEL